MTDDAKRPAPLVGGCRIEGFVRIKKVQITYFQLSLLLVFQINHWKHKNKSILLKNISLSLYLLPLFLFFLKEKKLILLFCFVDTLLTLLAFCILIFLFFFFYFLCSFLEYKFFCEILLPWSYEIWKSHLCDTYKLRCMILNAVLKSIWRHLFFFFFFTFLFSLSFPLFFFVFLFLFFLFQIEKPTQIATDYYNTSQHDFNLH